MEQRHYPRVKQPLAISLSWRGKPVGTFKTRDLSFDGMGLEPVSCDFGRDEPLILHLETGLNTQSMEGKVVHRADQGPGITLRDRDPDYVRIVLSALQRHGMSLPTLSLTEGNTVDSHDKPHSSEARSLLLQIGMHFDLRVIQQVLRAAQLLRDGFIDWVLIDFCMTRRVFDSGLGMLLMLNREAGECARNVVLLNCSPAITQRLEETGLQRQFSTP